MKILMVTPYLPYPLFSGGQVRSYNIIKELSKKHEITLFCAIRSEEENAYIPLLSKFARVKTFYRGRAFTLSHILSSFFSALPFILTVYQMPKLKEAIAKELVKNKYDLIHVETFYMMHNLPPTEIPIVLFEQNIEYEVYKKIAERFRPSIVRPLLVFDADKIKRWEQRFWDKANGLVVMSEAEKKLVSRQAYVCGNGVDIKKFKVPAFVKTSARQAKIKTGHRKKKILFIGNFKWFQNIDAVRFILEEIWPKILLEVRSQRLDVSVKLWIVGKNIPDSIKRLTSDENVIFDENAPSDTRRIYAEADVLLAPIRASGGTSYKVLEAMASGLAVVTTPQVENALEAKDGRELLIGNSPEELAQKTIEILQNNDLYKNLADNARKFVEENYDWKIITGKIEKIYQQTVSQKIYD